MVRIAAEMVEIRMTGNALEFKKIAYKASRRNFGFWILGRKSFSTVAEVTLNQNVPGARVLKRFIDNV